MNWHEFKEERPSQNQMIIITDGNIVAYAIWRGGLSNVLGLKGILPNLHSFAYWISLDEMLEMLS